MRWKKLDGRYLLVLDKGEEVIESITRFCQEKGIGSGSFSGIGATDKAVIGYLEKKDYLKKECNEDYEILNLIGNITYTDKAFVHAHIILGRSDYSTIGGHLFSAVVSVTCEIWINPSSDRVLRIKDDKIGVMLISI